MIRKVMLKSLGRLSSRETALVAVSAIYRSEMGYSDIVIHWNGDTPGQAALACWDALVREYPEEFKDPADKGATQRRFDHACEVCPDVKEWAGQIAGEGLQWHVVLLARSSGLDASSPLKRV